MPLILGLDIAGQPFRWLTPEDAVSYNATGKVAWSIGDPVVIFHGGYNRLGEQSIVQSAPIIAIARSDIMAAKALAYPPLGDRNDVLFKRDQHICAYCGDQFSRERLTRDHVRPRSKGGQDIWTNVVAACRSCNHRKVRARPTKRTCLCSTCLIHPADTNISFCQAETFWPTRCNIWRRCCPRTVECQKRTSSADSSGAKTPSHASDMLAWQLQFDVRAPARSQKRCCHNAPVPHGWEGIAAQER